MVALVRTNITLPEETLALVDAVAGPRGRSRYIADVVARQVRRDNARMVWERYAGALKDSDAWGRTDDEVLETLRDLRDDTDRERRIWAPYEEDEVTVALRPRHDAPDRPRTRKAKRDGARRAPAQRAE